MTKFSANLGFLWSDLPLPAAIQAAKANGFDAVECHCPYDFDASEIAAALQETGLKMLGLNTRRGNVDEGDNGLSAVPGREDEARHAIDEAISYAAAIECSAVHAMAGFAQGEQAQQCFVANLDYACKLAAKHDIVVLIEPLNAYDAPGYFLRTTDQAIQIIDEVNADNLRLMFDCYHVYLTEGDLTNRIKNLRSYIGHIQFAGAPGRGSPDSGDIAYSRVFKQINALGYDRPLGAEYRPQGTTEASLGWMKNHA